MSGIKLNQIHKMFCFENLPSLVQKSVFEFYLDNYLHKNCYRGSSPLFKNKKPERNLLENGNVFLNSQRLDKVDIDLPEEEDKLKNFTWKTWAPTPKELEDENFASYSAGKLFDDIPADSFLPEETEKKLGHDFFGKKCVFEYAATKLKEEHLPEVAFVGRSNVGKSSIMNAIVNRTNLMVTSKTPGRTQQINFFNVDSSFYLVDLPGYGFAKAKKEVTRKWQTFATEYIAERQAVVRVIVLIDARVGLKDTDIEMLTMLNERKKTYQVVLTKVDRVSPKIVSKLKNNIERYLESQEFCAVIPTVLATSCKRPIGIDELRAMILQSSYKEGATLG